MLRGWLGGFPKSAQKAQKASKAPSHVPACRCGWTRAKQQGAISFVEMCELSELSELSVLLFKFQRGGSVRLNRLMRHKLLFRVRRDGKTAFFQRSFFQRSMMVFLPPPRPGRCPVICDAKFVKELTNVRGRLGALLLITRSSAHSSLGEGTQNGKRGISLVAYEQLTKAEK